MLNLQYKDLRDFIDFLEVRGELKRITAEIDPYLEMTEICDRTLRAGGPALLFENPKGFNTPVLANLFGTEQRVALGMGQDSVEKLREVGQLLAYLKEPDPPKGAKDLIEKLPILKQVMKMGPKVVKSAPCQQVVINENDIDLSQIPVQTCWPDDAGPLITWPLVITRGPNKERQNLGIYRMQVIGKNRLIMRWLAHRGGALDFQAWQKAHPGENFPVAVALGADPATILGAVTPVPDRLSEYGFAALLRGEKTEVVNCVTSNLQVPASAEFVLEGYIAPDDEADEGPFGDHTGYYSVQEPYPVFHVTAVTQRRNPIYPTIVVGRPPQEDYWMGIATERLFLPLMRLMLPEIVDVHMPAEGVFHNLVLVSIRKEYPGHVQKTVSGMWGLGLMSLARAIAVFDHDVNIHDPSEIVWRLSNNVDPRRDIFFADGPIDDLDVSSPTARVGSKIGIDATRKSGSGEMGERRWMPDITMDSDVIDLVTRRWNEYGIS